LSSEVEKENLNPEVGGRAKAKSGGKLRPIAIPDWGDRSH